MFTANLQTTSRLSRLLKFQKVLIDTVRDYGAYMWNQQHQRERIISGIEKMDKTNPVKILPQASCASTLYECVVSSSTASLTILYAVSEAKNAKAAERMQRESPHQTLQFRSRGRLQNPKTSTAIIETTRHIKLYTKPLKPALANSLSMMKRELF